MHVFHIADSPSPSDFPLVDGNLHDTVLALIDHGSEINLMSKEFYRKGKWPINPNHGWKIWAATKATEDLFAACPDVTMKIGDVEIDQNFFVQDGVLLGNRSLRMGSEKNQMLEGPMVTSPTSWKGHICEYVPKSPLGLYV